MAAKKQQERKPLPKTRSWNGRRYIEGSTDYPEELEKLLKEAGSFKESDGPSQDSVPRARPENEPAEGEGTEKYSDLSDEQLRIEARDRNIKGYGSMKRDTLLARLGEPQGEESGSSSEGKGSTGDKQDGS
jgi:hypothetical protein